MSLTKELENMKKVLCEVVKGNSSKTKKIRLVQRTLDRLSKRINKAPFSTDKLVAQGMVACAQKLIENA